LGRIVGVTGRIPGFFESRTAFLAKNVVRDVLIASEAA
jgi:hypothetical protein